MSEQNKQEQKEPSILRLGDKVYDSDSVTEAGQGMINDLQKIDSVISQHQLAISIANTAKVKVIEELKKEAENFTEIEVPK